MTLSFRLKSARVLAKLSLREASDLADVSNAYISQLETGKITNPSPHILHRLAKAYEIPYEALMESAGYLHKGKIIKTLNLLGQSVTEEEEQKVLEYLVFLRTTKPKTKGGKNGLR